MMKRSTTRTLALLLAIAGTGAGCSGLIESSNVEGEKSDGGKGKPKPGKNDDSSSDDDEVEDGESDDAAGEKSEDGPNVDTGIGQGVFALCKGDKEQPAPRQLRRRHRSRKAAADDGDIDVRCHSPTIAPACRTRP